MKNTIILLLLSSLWGSAATWPAASASQANVESAISSASHGDTVTVPSGSATWTSFSLNKAITLQGAGAGVTTITLDECSVTKQASGVGLTIIEDFTFTKTGGGNEEQALYIGGANWPTDDQVIMRDQTWTVSGTGFVEVTTAGGVIFSNITITADHNDSIIVFKDPTDSDGSWSTNHSLGTADTTGKYNSYVEDCTITGGVKQGIDMDDGARVVFRYNTSTNFCLNSHGAATSTYGCHHYEIHDNDFNYTEGETEAENGNGHIWLRGGTGAIYDNDFEDISGYWGDKDEIRLNVRGAEDNRPQGACGNVSYPVPRQIGQIYSGSEQTDELRIWSNTGTYTVDSGWNWGNPCGLTATDFMDEDVVAYYVSTDATDARTSYTAYDYPHPALGGAASSVGSATATTLTIGP